MGSVGLSSARLDFVGRHVTLELFACNGVPEKLLNLPLWTEAPLSWIWEPSGWSQDVLLGSISPIMGPRNPGGCYFLKKNVLKYAQAAAGIRAASRQFIVLFGHGIHYQIRSCLRELVQLPSSLPPARVEGGSEQHFLCRKRVCGSRASQFRWGSILSAGTSL